MWLEMGFGWDIPNGGASLYTNWASTKTFLLGDTLTFNVATGRHDVVEVPKASFDGCSSNDAVQTITAGPANVTLSAAREHFLICSFGTHCAAGQKLAVNVSGDSSTASPSRPTTTAHSPTSPAICPPESSPSPVAGGPKSWNSVPPPPAGSSAPAASAASLLSMLSVGLSFFISLVS